MKDNPYLSLSVENLSVGFKQNSGKRHILHSGINFSASPGEMVALIGSNGIGKTTLLRSVTGFQESFGGVVKINGTDLGKISLKEKARLIAFVSTESIRMSNMTVFDLVAYGRFPYTGWFGNLAENDRKLVHYAIDNVGLSGFEFHQLSKISDGERQRAMIARALAQDTPIIILDEPTAFLDVSNKYGIFHLLQTLAAEKGVTIVLSTHDLNIALREVDKLWIMIPGGNLEGAPEDAVLHGWLNRLFNNEHIGFDVEAGEYFFKKEFREKVRVIGEGVPLLWTLRAFNRCGYQIVMNVKPDFIVTIHDRGDGTEWIVDREGKTTKYASLYDLLNGLKQKDSKFGQ
jgi:iron complex transport system ATP-binding protein